MSGPHEVQKPNTCGAGIPARRWSLYILGGPDARSGNEMDRGRLTRKNRWRAGMPAPHVIGFKHISCGAGFQPAWASCLRTIAHGQSLRVHIIFGAASHGPVAHAATPEKQRGMAILRITGQEARATTFSKQSAGFR